jgi:hypothetical protein
MPIVPDTKDWTWVLTRRCPECGYDSTTIAPIEVADRLRENAVQWQDVLRRDDVGTRPSADRWSPLEYACHVRDVFVLYRERLDLMLDTNDPLYPNWNQDTTAIERRYAEQEPAQVAPELATAAESLAGRFDRVAGSMWQRPGRRSDGATFTVDTFARYLLHDVVHHLWDVRASRD